MDWRDPNSMDNDEVVVADNRENVMDEAMAERTRARMMHYIHDDTYRVIPEPDLMKWAMFFEFHRFTVSNEVWPALFLSDGPVRVSSVFLGIDHRFTGDGPPLVWETMIFGGPLDQRQYRAATYAEIMAIHARCVEMARWGLFVRMWEQVTGLPAHLRWRWAMHKARRAR